MLDTCFDLPKHNLWCSSNKTLSGNSWWSNIILCMNGEIFVKYHYYLYILSCIFAFLNVLCFTCSLWHCKLYWVTWRGTWIELWTRQKKIKYAIGMIFVTQYIDSYTKLHDITAVNKDNCEVISKLLYFVDLHEFLRRYFYMYQSEPNGLHCQRHLPVIYV